MNIGITCYPTYGGSGVVATELGIELAKKGHNVHFISYGLPFRLDKFYRNIFFHEVEMLEYPLFKYPPYSLSLSVKMAEIIESQSLDILHVHYAMPHATSAYLAQKILGKNKIKFITTLHGTDITLVGNHESFYRITKFSIEESDGVTCVSEYLKDTTEKIFKTKKAMEVIYNFVDTNRYKRTSVDKRDLDFLDEDDRVITHISNFRPVKRVESVIEVFRLISKEIKSKLLLIGDGPDISKCRKMVDRLGLEDKVVFLGRQEDIITLLNMSNLYMIPSNSESFGLSALEALSCGVPVIGTSMGGLREVVEHGVSGYIIDPDDIQLMGETAIRILADQAVWEKISTAARKRAELFDVDLIVPKYLKYYNNIIST